MTATTRTEAVPEWAYEGKHRGLSDYFDHLKRAGYVGKHRKDNSS